MDGEKKVQDLILCIFVHGFKGTDSTFAGFPERLQHLLTETVESAKVECVVYPAYETKGDLNLASEKFIDWLTTITVEKEVARGEGGGAGKAKVVLCGHSMGGLVAVDAILSIASSGVDSKAPIWPRIIACVAFDTPYFGLHPLVFKNTASKAVGYVQAFQDIASGIGLMGLGASLGSKPSTRPPNPDQKLITAPPEQQPAAKSSGWGLKGWAPAIYGVGGAILAGAAAGAVYQRRSDVEQGWSWLSGHMQYVGNLWDDKAMKARVGNLIGVGKERGIVFRNFYTYLPPQPPAHPNPRTFIILPPQSSPYVAYFSRVSNGIAQDEVGAHMGMFEASSNDGYYDLGLRAAELVRNAIAVTRD